mmetsp:Transcript_32222/g.63948  ORF Transcript_32222/g.63948 Transcript_32222/m.63948 type:complete len:93 (-) Transcript_32222:120-398(-)
MFLVEVSQWVRWARATAKEQGKVAGEGEAGGGESKKSRQIGETLLLFQTGSLLAFLLTSLLLGSLQYLGMYGGISSKMEESLADAICVNSIA